MSEPKVSVIMPFFNPSPQFMRDTIESVLAQTYPNWELLLVDDGSTNGATDLARQYTEGHPRKIIYLEHDGHANRGISISRQMGMTNASGKYAALLDADDIWLPRKLEHQTKLLEQHRSAAMLYGNTKYWYSWNPENSDVQDFVPSLGVTPGQVFSPRSLLPLFLEGKAAVPVPCSVLIRLNAVKQLGGFEEKFTGMYEDQVLYAKICLHCGVYVSSKCLDFYRQHDDSCCEQAKAVGHLVAARLNYLQWLEEYLLAENISDSQVWQSLRRAQWRTRHPWPARLLRFSRKTKQRLSRHVAAPP